MIRRDFFKTPLAVAGFTLAGGTGLVPAAAAAAELAKAPGLTKYVSEFIVNTKYEDIPCVIKKEGTKTRITTVMAGFNYTEFVIELNEAPFMVEDGAFVQSKALDLEGELLVRNRRMVFIKGSKPFDAVKDAKTGDRFHVLGVPRINLALVSWRTRNGAARPEVLDWSLPYEMVIVGVYDGGVPEAEDE